MKWRSPISKLAAALVAMFALAYGLAIMPVQAAPQKYTPFTDTRPAQGVINEAARITDPAELADIARNIPPMFTPADFKAGAQYRTMANFYSNAGMRFNTSLSHGLLVPSSVMGSLSLTKPSAGVSHAVISPFVQAYGSCLYGYLEHNNGPNYTSTVHRLVVVNGCNGTNVAWTVDATTWANYGQNGSIVSLTDFGVYIPDKISYFRLYESNTTAHTWAFDVWNFATSSYDNASTYTGSNYGGTNVSMFLHSGDTTVTSAYCGNLGVWNVAQAFGMQEWTGSAMTPIPSSHISASFAYAAGSPCLNIPGGSSAWYYVDTGLTAPGAGPAWSVCGPSKTECRP